MESGFGKIWVIGTSTVFSENRKSSFQGINAFGFDIGQTINKNKYFADGKVTAFTFDFAFGGGGGFVIGKVRDKYGDKKWFFSANANFGFGISVDLYRADIHNVHGNDFNASDYEGFSGGLNWSALFFGGQKSGDKLMWDFNHGIFGNTYIEEGNTISISPLRFGSWWSNSKTWIMD